MRRISVNPDTLSQARIRAGMTQDKLASKFKKLPEWESGQLCPTLKQLEAFARAVRVPFGYLFCQELPSERLPITDFRAIQSGKRPPSPDLIDTLYAMQQRQSWLQERLCDAEPLDFAASASLSDDPVAVGQEMRRVLGMHEKWIADIPCWQDVVPVLCDKLGQLGVMAVVNEIVGNNTHRSLSVAEFRGFSLFDQRAPLFFVNGADVKAAWMFTLACQLVHIWLGESSLSDFDYLLFAPANIADWRHQAAAEFLAPEQEMRNVWDNVKQDRRPFDALSYPFRISPVLAARRALDLDLIKPWQYFKFYEASIMQTSQKQRTLGGDFYKHQDLRLGAFFATQVIRAAMAGEMGFKEAYALTGLCGGVFQKYANRFLAASRLQSA